eukprot:TRINITY_DN79983_c0_g1_i1.p1 TRINITY_DN79983_c0_g1~~TRINITY_DN79983_c0_g1_i1.p1  ORF type:complete len:451 (-),score=36.32 TRINITY_DN79983_c0_g1_i1:501-1853(-)
MVFPEPQTQPNSPMSKPSTSRSKPSFFSDLFVFLGGAMLALLLVWTLFSYINPNPKPSFYSSVSANHESRSTKCAVENDGGRIHRDPPDPNFYDDPNLSYSIEKRIVGWDEKRRDWIRQHPEFLPGAGERVLLLTGSQPSPCTNPIGDHLLLRFFKNKVDYCRIHGYDIFYNNALLHPKMGSFWAKIPAVRAAMVAHPEAEWIWWVDSDAAFTDMEFRLPLAKYKDHNLIVHGWSNMVYENKSWVSLNAGVFLMRNSQWSLDFMDVWASMGPQTPEYDKWGKIQKSIFKDKLFPESDDQTGLVYLLLMEREKWADRIYLESEYYFEGYWVEIVGTLKNISEKYVEVERGVRRLRRRRAEKVSVEYGEVREEHMKGWGGGRWGSRRPFITHFTGCQPCSGDHNAMYSGESCWDEMRRVLNFADNQVLRSFGYVREDLLDARVSELPFDYPA